MGPQGRRQPGSKKTGPYLGALGRGRALTPDLGGGPGLRLHQVGGAWPGAPHPHPQLPIHLPAVTWEGATTSSSLDSAVVSSTKVSFLEGAGPTGGAQASCGALHEGPQDGRGPLNVPRPPAQGRLLFMAFQARHLNVQTFHPSCQGPLTLPCFPVCGGVALEFLRASAT